MVLVVHLGGAVGGQLGVEEAPVAAGDGEGGSAVGFGHEVIVVVVGLVDHHGVLALDQVPGSCTEHVADHALITCLIMH